MNEKMYQQSQREFHAREDRRDSLIQALTALACAAAFGALIWVAATMDSMQDYWIGALVIAGIILAVFLSFGFGWILYGVLAAFAWMGFAALVGLLILIFQSDPGAIVAILFICAVAGFAHLLSAMRG